MFMAGLTKMKDEPIDVFLNRVHSVMELKYAKKPKAEIANAYKLQLFFQQLKRGAQGEMTDGLLSQETLTLILNNIETLGKSRYKNFNIKRLFTKRGGTRFENEIARVIEGVYYELSNQDVNQWKTEWENQRIVVGKERSSIRGLDKVIFDERNPMDRKMVELIGLKTYRVIEDKVTKEKFKQYYFSDVQGKVDVQGYKITINKQPTPELMQIYNLLKDATFSAKNYDSQKIVGKNVDSLIKEFNPGHTTLTLGKTNTYRALSGSLHYLGINSKKTIDNIIFSGLTVLNSGKDTNEYNDVANHFYHLRYLYELTGAGIVGKDGKSQRVKYLIYNDPSGNIYVKSTYEIIADILGDNLNKNKKLITISKDAFK